MMAYYCIRMILESDCQIMIYALEERDYDVAELGVLFREARSLVLGISSPLLNLFQFWLAAIYLCTKFEWNTFFHSRKTWWINLFYPASTSDGAR